jgi:hypothetical protein
MLSDGYKVSLLACQCWGRIHNPNMMKNLETINSCLKSSAIILSIESPISYAIVVSNKSSLVIIRSIHFPVDLAMFWLSSQMQVDKDPKSFAL